MFSRRWTSDDKTSQEGWLDVCGTRTFSSFVPLPLVSSVSNIIFHHKFDNDMSSMLFNLRCSSINDFKDNFHTLYGNLPPCKMLCGKGIDSQRHALSCKAILEKLSLPELETMNQLRYSHLYGSISEQENITMMFSRILQIRAADKSTATGLPGHNNSGPGWYNHQFTEINIYVRFGINQTLTILFFFITIFFFWNLKKKKN